MALLKFWPKVHSPKEVWENFIYCACLYYSFTVSEYFIHKKLVLRVMEIWVYPFCVTLVLVCISWFLCSCLCDVMPYSMCYITMYVHYAKTNLVLKLFIERHLMYFPYVCLKVTTRILLCWIDLLTNKRYINDKGTY
jgi:hypothetical protein